MFFLSLFYFSISPAHIKTIHIHIITYSTPPLHANPLETIKSFFNRNINTSAIWLPQEKQMRWKQAIKIETLYKERKKYTTRDPVLERHGVRGNTLTQRHEKWRSVSTRKDKVFCLCFYWEMNEKKRWHAFNVTLRAFFSSFFQLLFVYGHIWSTLIVRVYTKNFTISHASSSKQVHSLFLWVSVSSSIWVYCFGRWMK